MSGKLIVLAAVVVACRAVPIWISGEDLPGVVMRVSRSPNMAFGYGSGFSSNIGGISHSTGMGASFQSGDAQAYGAGIGSISDDGAYARGVGVANAAPLYPIDYQQSSTSAFNGGRGRTSYGSALSEVQHFGGNYGAALSSAQALNGPHYGSAVSTAQNHGPLHYQSALSSAQNLRGLGYDAEDGGYESAISNAQSHGPAQFNSAISAAQNIGGVRASTAHALNQRGAQIQHSGASSINAPGLQAAQSHAVNSGFY